MRAIHCIRILIMAGMVCWAQPLAALDSRVETGDSVPTYQMGEIVVRGKGAPCARTALTSEISSREIEALDVRNNAQAMAFAPGVYFSRTSRNETTFRLRGFEQRQVTVFLDGVPVSIPYDGLVDLSQFVGDDLQRVQISKGIPSVLYGANAMGGSVNLITTPPGGEREARLRLEGSDHGHFFSNANVRGGIGTLQCSGMFSFQKAPDFALSGRFEPQPNQDKGRRDNSAFQKMGARLKVLLPVNPANQVALHMTYIDNEFQVPPNASVSRPRYWGFPEWINGVVSLNSEHEINRRLGLRTVWFYNRYHNLLRSYDDDTYTTQNRGYAFDSTYDDDSLGVILYPRFDLLSLGSTRGMFSYRKDVHRERTDEDPWERYATETFTGGLEQEVDLTQNLSLVAGVNANALRPTDAEQIPLREDLFLVNGMAAIQYRLLPAFTVHCAFSRNSRFPTLKELYSERLGRNMPNPDLKAEQSWNTEAGIRWSGLNGYLQAAFFYNNLQDLIANKQLGNNVQQLQNIDKALLWGMELAWQGSWKDLSWYANYTLLRAENQSLDRDSDLLEYRPKHRVNLLLKYRVYRTLFLLTEFSFTAEQYYENPDSLAWEELNDFALLNLKAEYGLGSHLVVYLRSNNVTDESYMSEYGVPMPGREILGGVRMHF